MRAFSTYFNLVNVAEEIDQHSRYYLSQQKHVSETLSEVKSFEDILRFFKEEDIGAPTSTNTPAKIMLYANLHCTPYRGTQADNNAYFLIGF